MMKLHEETDGKRFWDIIDNLSDTLALLDLECSLEWEIHDGLVKYWEDLHE